MVQATDICLRLWLEEIGISAKDMKPQAELEKLSKRSRSEQNLAPPDHRQSHTA